jgi:hypothetical protein
MGSLAKKSRHDHRLESFQEILELIGIDRFDEVKVDSDFAGAESIRFSAITTEGYQERPLARCSLADFLGDLPTIHSGQSQVKKHHVGVNRLDHFQSGPAIGGNVNLMSIETQHERRAGCRILMIFDHEHTEALTRRPHERGSGALFRRSLGCHVGYLIVTVRRTGEIATPIPYQLLTGFQV